jgi:hypothetical protein
MDLMAEGADEVVGLAGRDHRDDKIRWRGMLDALWADAERDRVAAQGRAGPNVRRPPEHLGQEQGVPRAPGRQLNPVDVQPVRSELSGAQAPEADDARGVVAEHPGPRAKERLDA